MSSTTPTAPRPPDPAPTSLRAGLISPVTPVRWLWQAYMTPGTPGRPTSQQELRWIYAAWLVAFGLKMLGSSWDVSWHFMWLRDDLAPPHLLNSAGTVLVVALVAFAGYSGYGVDRRALRLMQWGIGIFLLAVPRSSSAWLGLQLVMSRPLTRWLTRSTGTASRKTPVPHCISRSARRSTP